jgi:hypothetical protein
MSKKAAVLATINFYQCGCGRHGIPIIQFATSSDLHAKLAGGARRNVV